MTAELYIQTFFRDGRTILKDLYRTQPFRVADITEDKSQKALRLMLMSSSPGILDGDKYKIGVVVAKDCSLEMETQSYQRLFHMKNGAVQEMEVRMEQNSSFVFLPHPSVPHDSSIFTSKNKFYLCEGCRLAWGEVLTSGRKLSGENFLFSKYHSLTEIFWNEKLVVKENLLMSPKIFDVNTIGQLEGYTHQASFIYIGQEASITSAIEKINSLLEDETEICFGLSALPVNGLVVHLLGHKGEQLHNCLKRIAAYFSHDLPVVKPLAYAP